MPRKTASESPVYAWEQIVTYLSKQLPHLSSVLNDAGEFRGLSVVARDDGTCLAMVKGYSADGGLTICFGIGYDTVLALMAVDRTIQGGHWKVDKPYEDRKK